MATDNSGWSTLATWACIWGLWYAGSAAWHSKARYSVQYGVPLASVARKSEPYDCEFLTPPLGSKHCSYEPEVSTIRTGVSTTGKPIASFDEGKTWQLDDGAFRATPGVYISWKKVDDDQE